jgi:DNA repair exonuclease SbcCD ATPase subunit
MSYATEEGGASHDNFQERLTKIKAKWEDATANPESMTVEAKRQCLEELSAVCKSLNSMRDGLVEAAKEEDKDKDEKIRINRKIDDHMSRLYKIKDEMKSLGVKLNGLSPSPSLYGYLPSNWMDRSQYGAEMKRLKEKIDGIEEEFEKLKPAVDYSRSTFQNGIIQDAEIILPPPTSFLRMLRDNIRNDHTYIEHVRGKITSFESQLRDKRREFHNLLSNCKPVDIKTLRDKLSKLNRERETIIYELRMFECKGFYTGFNAQDFVLD